MSRYARIVDERDVQRPPKAGRFDQVSILLHWLTVLLVIEQLTTAWLLSQGYGFAPVLLTTHRSLGVLTAIVVFLRLLWRRRFAYLPPFPDTMPKLQQRVAKLNEYSLYALL